MNPKVDEYIDGLKQEWQRKIMRELRHIIHKADSQMQETLKWGTPTFEHDGIVAWMFSAKDWVHFSFPQGALLDNSHGLFEQTENKAKRTIKFNHGDKLPSKIITQLIKQAVENNTSERRIEFKPEPKKPIVLPQEMATELKAYGLEDTYAKRPYYQQKGYIEWIGQAKHDETRIKRIAKMIEELQEGSYMPAKRNKA